MKCFRCGKEDGNYRIWVLPNGIDPPTCYCPRETEEGEIILKPPCKGVACWPDWTHYPCQYCNGGLKEAADDWMQELIADLEEVGIPVYTTDNLEKVDDN